jgi:hypothetical protein
LPDRNADIEVAPNGEKDVTAVISVEKDGLPASPTKKGHLSAKGDNADQNIPNDTSANPLDGLSRFQAIIKKINLASGAEWLDDLQELEKLYNNKMKEKSSKNKRVSHPYPKTKAAFQEEFNGDEEKEHPWMPRNRYPNALVDGKWNEKLEPIGPLVRAWDHKSKAKITDKRVGLLSGRSTWKAKGLLSTISGRKESIAAHGNRRNRTLTPYISTTTSCNEIFRYRIPHFNRRQEVDRLIPNTMITLINPYIRLQRGLPVLKMKDEMRHYGVINEYSEKYYEDEYLLPFNSGPKEIVCTWTAADIYKQMKNNKWSETDWWEKELMVKFREHEQARKEGKVGEHTSGCKCCGH